MMMTHLLSSARIIKSGILVPAYKSRKAGKSFYYSTTIAKYNQRETIEETTKAFLDALLQHPITEIDLSEEFNSKNYNINDAAMLKQIKKIKSTIKDDRVYKFVKRMNSLDDFEMPTLDSIVWKDVSNAVEVYMLPPPIRWPTNDLPKQNSPFFPNFVIRRMNNLHRHRVLATLNRLWYDSKNEDGKYVMTCAKIVWAGSSGTGMSVAMNEIILESVLKLNEIGLENQKYGLPTPNQFFLRNSNYLTRFYFDKYDDKVSCEVLYFEDREYIIQFLDNEAHRKKSFVIFEMNEYETDPVTKMSFLTSTYCEGLVDKTKTTYKTNSSQYYLYDPMLYFEFKFLMNTCYAFGEETQKETSIDIILDRYSLNGGIIRNLLRNDKNILTCEYLLDRNNHLALIVKLNQANPMNISPQANSILCVKFRIQLQFEGEKGYDDWNKNYQFLCEHHSYRIKKNAKLYYSHQYHHWYVDFVTDEMAIKFGNELNLPQLAQDSKSYSTILKYVQKAVNIYSGILQTMPKHVTIKPRPAYYMKHWDFFRCSKKDLNVVYNQKTRYDGIYHRGSTRIPVMLDSLCTLQEKDILMSMMPTTDRISTFEGAYLKTPFNELLPNKVYRSYSNNGPVFDALTADPTAGRLFLYQSTLRNPYDLNVNIIEFNNVISNLSKDATSSSSSSSTSDSIKEIYYFIIASAHQEFSSQHFYSFSIEELYLHSCYMSAYTTEEGINTLRKIVSICPLGGRSGYGRNEISKEDVKRFSEKELLLMKTFCGCNDRSDYYTYTMDLESYEHLFLFLEQYASKLSPYLCRAKFNNSTAYSSPTVTKPPTVYKDHSYVYDDDDDDDDDEEEEVEAEV